LVNSGTIFQFGERQENVRQEDGILERRWSTAGRSSNFGGREEDAREEDVREGDERGGDGILKK
jgi:hypothetical protein